MPRQCIDHSKTRIQDISKMIIRSWYFGALNPSIVPPASTRVVHADSKCKVGLLYCIEMIPTATTAAAEASARWETKFWVRWHADGTDRMITADVDVECVISSCRWLNGDEFLEKQTLLQWPGPNHLVFPTALWGKYRTESPELSHSLPFIKSTSPHRNRRSIRLA